MVPRILPTLVIPSGLTVGLTLPYCTVNQEIFLNLHLLHQVDNMTRICVNIFVGSNLEANSAFLQCHLSIK